MTWGRKSAMTARQAARSTRSYWPLPGAAMSWTPRARRASTTKLPRKPPPPVTSTRLPASGEGPAPSFVVVFVVLVAITLSPMFAASQRVPQAALHSQHVLDDRADLGDRGRGLLRAAGDPALLHGPGES